MSVLPLPVRSLANEWLLSRLCTNLLAFTLPQLGYRVMKAVRLVIASSGVPYFQVTSLGPRHVSKGHGRKEGKVTGLECHISHIYQLMIKAIMRWSRRPCTDLLAFTSQMRKTPKNFHEGCMTSHRLKWGPLPSNEVGVIAQYVRKG